MSCTSSLFLIAIFGLSAGCIALPEQTSQTPSPQQDQGTPDAEASDMAPDQHIPDQAPSPSTQRNIVEAFIGTYPLAEIFGVDERLDDQALEVIVTQLGVQIPADALLSLDSQARTITFHKQLTKADNIALSLTAQGSTIATIQQLYVDIWFQLAAGKQHTCGLSAEQRVYCWGNNEQGQLGHLDNKNNITRPTRVALPDDAPAWRAPRLLAQGWRTYLFETDGNNTTFAWGDNRKRQLSTEFVDALPPTLLGLWDTSDQFLGASDTATFYNKANEGIQMRSTYRVNEQLTSNSFGRDLDARPHRATETLLCGADGGGAPICLMISAPDQLVTHFANITKMHIISAQEGYQCAHDQTTVQCIATDAALNDERVGNDGADEQLVTPREVFKAQGNETIAQIALGQAHGCVLTDAGKLYCWGTLPAGIFRAEKTPRAELITSLGEDWSQLSATWNHTCVVNGRSGQALCWGNNEDGQLGVSERTPTTPQTPQAPLPMVR